MYLISGHRQWFSYRGLSPYKFMPMLGVHNTINSDHKKLRYAPLFVSGYGWR